MKVHKDVRLGLGGSEPGARWVRATARLLILCVAYALGIWLRGAESSPPAGVKGAALLQRLSLKGPPEATEEAPESDWVVSTLAGGGDRWGNRDGPGAVASFRTPYGLAVGPSGELYVADINTHAIRRITPAGVVTTLAGNGEVRGYRDGKGPEARFNAPAAVAVDSHGDVFVGECYGCAIRRITSSGQVTTIIHPDQPFHAYPNARAMAVSPAAIVIGDHGELYFSSGSTGPAVGLIEPGREPRNLQVGPTGHLWPFGSSWGLARSSKGQLYMTDADDHVVWAIASDRPARLVAGRYGHKGHADGKGAKARFCWPSGLAVDQLDNLYVADRSNQTIRRITPDGRVKTVAGMAGREGYRDGPARQALFDWPIAVAVDNARAAIYVADANNSAIRKIVPVRR